MRVYTCPWAWVYLFLCSMGVTRFDQILSLTLPGKLVSMLITNRPLACTRRVCKRAAQQGKSITRKLRRNWGKFLTELTVTSITYRMVIRDNVTRREVTVFILEENTVKSASLRTISWCADLFVLTSAQSLILYQSTSQLIPVSVSGTVP